jgi:NAD-dependent deacetylase
MKLAAAEAVESIQTAASLIKNSKNCVALTGAGISTRSGIPDFRTPGKGLWTQADPMEVASLSAFRHDPEKFYNWFHVLAVQMYAAQPNPAHTALARLENAGYLSAIITQNIDGLHTRAGAHHVLQVHGSLDTLTCTDCYRQVPASSVMEEYLNNCCMPRCPSCNAVLKPDVILFEEQLPVKIWNEAEEACRKCELMLVVGTSLEVLPSAKLPVLALDHGAKLIIINNTETFMDQRANVVIHGDVAEALPQIADKILGV